MVGRLRAAAAAFALLWAHATQAVELRIVNGERYKALLLTGEMGPGDARRLDQLLRQTGGVGEVQLHSPGGSLAEGIRMGQILRDAKLATRVPAKATCASACFYTFIGGIIRTVDPGGQLGVHMASLAMQDEWTEKLREVLQNRKFNLDDRVRMITLMSEQTAAYAAGYQATFIVRMGVSLGVLDKVFDTMHIDMHWLTPREMAEFNVVN